MGLVVLAVKSEAMLKPGVIIDMMTPFFKAGKTD